MASRTADRPNILFILSDDQGPWAMNCAGTPELKSPNLDRLAESGIRFENFFCASPVCSPARASILTGQMPSQHGVQDFLRAGNSTELPEDGKTIRYLDGRTSYVELLRDAGYVTGLSGKWHLGNSSSPQVGFDFWDVFATGSGDYYDSPMFKNGEAYKGDGYVSDVITDNAIGFLDDQLGSESPFSLNVHFTAPHAPWDRHQHPSELYDDYFENCKFESVRWDPVHPDHLEKKGSSGSVGQTAEQRQAMLSGYFAAITQMDHNIGRLLDWLEANDLRESTVVVFTSDNGMSMGHHGIWGKGNGTYPPNMFDTAVKVPTLMSMPGFLPQGVVSRELLSHYDFFPTLTTLAGVFVDDDVERPGTSFARLVDGENPGETSPVVVHDEYGKTRMIRTQSLKYIHRYPEGPHEFYDLANDPNEVKNAIDDVAFRSIIRAMRKDLFDWFERYSEPERDGSKQDVMGRGQLDVIGGDEEPFAQDVEFLLR